MRQVTPEEYYHSANTYFNSGSPDKALRLLNTAIQFNPNYLQAYKLRARIHRSLIKESGILGKIIHWSIAVFDESNIIDLEHKLISTPEDQVIDSFLEDSQWQP